MNSFKGNISFFKGWLNFSLFKVLELLPTKARWKSHSTLTLLATQNYPFWLKYD